MEGEGFDGNQICSPKIEFIYASIAGPIRTMMAIGLRTLIMTVMSMTGNGPESNELEMITEHVYESGQVEARVGNPHNWEGDGLIVTLWSESVRAPNKDPLHIEFDWTAFGPANDSWISAPSNLTIAAQSNSVVNVTIDVPSSARGGLKQHGLRIEANTNNTTRTWSWPVITNVGFSGPFFDSASTD